MQAKERQDRFASFLHTMFLASASVQTASRHAGRTHCKYLSQSVPRKRTLPNRGNFRGITMQSAISKLFCQTVHNTYLVGPCKATCQQPLMRPMLGFVRGGSGVADTYSTSSSMTS